MSSLLRVLVINGNRLLLNGISAFVQAQPGLVLIGRSDTADAGLGLFKATDPDVTLIDIDLPDESGIQAITFIRAVSSTAWVIALAGCEANERAVQAFAAGACTVLPKDLIQTLLLPLLTAGRPPTGSLYAPPMLMELSAEAG